MAVDANGLHIIPPQDSLALVARHLPHIGRVALPDDDGPLVLPVNYRVVDDTVVFRTGSGSQLAAAAGGRQVAFEVDEVDETWEEGWSVLIRGSAVEVTDPDELARLRGLPLRPWAGGDKPTYIRIVPAAISGRRIG